MNFDAVRKIVSGKKARFSDVEVGVNLDLAYITDNIIIMGYPATGLEGLYRNRRRDVKKWLESRHSRKWRIYNFCPRNENEYDAEYFHGQVKRFPFPDHHPPPLSLIPLFTYDINTFLESDPENVAVIHCKAGKGRSGTMTISYLQTLATLPKPPQLARNYSVSQRRLLAEYTKDAQDEKDGTRQESRVSTPGSMSSISLSSTDEDFVHVSEETPVDGYEGNTAREIPKKSANGTSASAHVAMDASGLRGEGKSTRTALKADALIQGLLGVSHSEGLSNNATVGGPGEVALNEGEGDASPGGCVKIPSGSHLCTGRSGTEVDSDSPKRLNSGVEGSGGTEAHAELEERGKSQDIPGKMNNLVATACHPSSTGAQCGKEKGPTKNVLSGTEDEKEAVLAGKSPAEREAALMADKIQFLFRLHTSQRMADPNVAYGVSIPSQRRWIRYWGSVLTGDDRRKVGNGRQIEVKWVRVTLALADRLKKVVGNALDVAVQLSRYKDSYVADLAEREDTLYKARAAHREAKRKERTASGDTMKPELPHSQKATSIKLVTPDFDDNAWDDKDDLFVTFASFGEDGRRKNEDPPRDDDGETKLSTRHLTPLRLYETPPGSANRKVKGGTAIEDVGGVTADAARELQFKIVLGSTGSKHAALPDVASLGYFWFIPAFHGGPSDTGLTVTSFPKEEIDFRKKQARILQVDIGWRWLGGDEATRSLQEGKDCAPNND